MLPPPETAVLPPPTVFRGVRVFEGTEDELTPPIDVLVVNGRIAAMGAVKAPAGAAVVDGAGKTLLPGLIDCHVHLGGGDGEPPWAAGIPSAEAQAAALLYSGVTAVIVAGNEGDTAALWEDIQSGDLAGPRLYRSGKIVTAEGGLPVPLYEAALPWLLEGVFLSRTVHQAGDPREAAAAARDDLEYLRPDFVKVVYDSLPPGAPHLSRASLVAIVEEAKHYEKRVVVHVSTPKDAVEAAEAGAALLMHVPWDGALDRAQADALAYTGVPVVTTRSVFTALRHTFDGTKTFSALERAVMKPGTEEAFRAPRDGWVAEGFPPGYVAALPAFDRAVGENVKLLREAGVPLLAGTDAGLPGMFHGPALHEELAALVALGIPTAEVLRMATALPARFLEAGATFGVIAPGARADLLLVEGDPLADIRATQAIAGVWQGGRRVR